MQVAELTVMLHEARRRVPEMDARLRDIETELAANTKVTTEVREVLDTFKGGMRMLGWMGIAAKWIAGIAAAIGAVIAIWETLRSGGPPRH